MNHEIVYISGKISALTLEGVQANKDRMVDAAVGYVVTHPNAAPILPGENSDRMGARLGWDWKEYMRADLQHVRVSDKIYMVEGWEESRGARIEHFLAKKWGIPVEYEMEQGLDYSLMEQ